MKSLLQNLFILFQNKMNYSKKVTKKQKAGIGHIKVKVKVIIKGDQIDPYSLQFSTKISFLNYKKIIYNVWRRFF